MVTWLFSERVFLVWEEFRQTLSKAASAPTYAVEMLRGELCHASVMADRGREDRSGMNKVCVWSMRSVRLHNNAWLYRQRSIFNAAFTPFHISHLPPQ